MDEGVTSDVIEDVRRGVKDEVVEYVFENVLGDVSFPVFSCFMYKSISNRSQFLTSSSYL